MRTHLLTPHQANQIFDVLVRYAEAPEWKRDEFVLLHSEGRCDEFRFMGCLGFGGKYWRHDWRVSAYPEDIKREPLLQTIIDTTNHALAELREVITRPYPSSPAEEAR